MTAPLVGGELPPGLEDDPDILEAVKALTLAAISEAQHLIDNGIPAVKMQLIRTVLPAAAKALASKKGTDAKEELQAEMKKMYAGVRGAIGAD